MLNSVEHEKSVKNLRASFEIHLCSAQIRMGNRDNLGIIIHISP